MHSVSVVSEPWHWTSPFSSPGTEIALALGKTTAEERKASKYFRDEEKVKTNYQKRRTSLLSGGCFLALVVSVFPVIFAEDQPAVRPAVEPNDNSLNSRRSKELERRRETVGLVGPSGEDIHDFLYPAPENPEIVTSANEG